jgi:hypothetical protein
MVAGLSGMAPRVANHPEEKCRYLPEWVFAPFVPQWRMLETKIGDH